MSLDRSLKSANALVRHRNVLTRAERLVKLAEEERWDESKSVYGLPKVEHRKQALAKTLKEEAAEAAEGAAVAGAAPVAGGVAPAGAAAKGAAAGGAKGAAAGAAKTAAPAAKAAAPAAKSAAPAGKKK
ncbi:MAG: small basic protein [Tepidisphaeraceae bacterium]|jgi:small basic protein (TIGR04137 family)